MGIVFRQSVKNSIVVAGGAIMGAFIIWLSTTSLPDKHQYGFTQSLTTYAVAASQLLLFGLNYTLAVYIHKYADNDAKRKALLAICLLIPLALCILVTFVYFALRSWLIHHFQAEDIPYMQRYYALLPVYILLFVYQLLLEQYLGSQMKVAVAAFMREILVRVINIVLLLLFAFNYVSFDILVCGMVFMYLVPVTIFWLLSFRTKAFGLSFNFRAIEASELKEILSYSWYHFLLGIALTCTSFLDMLLLPFYDHQGFGSVAIYRNAMFLISLLQLPFKALSVASFAVLAKAFADNDIPHARNLFNRSSINIFILTMFAAVVITCNLQNIVAIIKNDYSQIIPVFLILALGRLVDCATGMNDQVLSIANYYKFNFYLSLSLTVVLFVLLRVLIPLYGVYGAAWSTTITFVIFNLIKYAFVRWKLGMSPLSRKTLLVCFAGLAALAAGYFFPYFFSSSAPSYLHTFADAVLRSIVITVVYALMLLWLQPSPDLKEYIGQVKKNKRLF